MFYYSASSNSFYPGDMRGAYESYGTWPDDAVSVSEEEWSTYGAGCPPSGMVRGSDSQGRPAWVSEPPLPLGDLKALYRKRVEDGRKQAEAEGVTHNGIRYAGDQSNRQALKEAVDLADATGQEAFVSWKDSDGEFHANHPVEDVRQALLKIAERRGELIAREAELSADIKAAAEAEDRESLEAIHW